MQEITEQNILGQIEAQLKILALCGSRQAALLVGILIATTDDPDLIKTIGEFCIDLLEPESR